MRTPQELLPHRTGTFLLMAALLVATSAAIYEGYQASRQRQEIQRLQREQGRLAEQIQHLEHARDKALKPRLPAPHMQIAAERNTSSAEELQATNLYARFAKDPPKLTAEQVEAYLKANGRKACNLLAAYRTSGAPALLMEAMQNYPNDPQVAFEAVFKGDLSAEQRRQWLSTFEQTAPDNALANYLSAREYLKGGQTDLAIQELMAASGKTQFQDYTLERMQDNEEAYLASGYSAAAAKMLGSGEVMLPQLAELKQLGLQMVDQANSYRKAGDETSAQAVLQMAVALGQNYGGGSAGDCAISHLVGLVIQRNALSAMDPRSLYGDFGGTVQDQLNQISQQKTAISSFFKENDALLQTMSDEDWISYVDRIKSSGEEAALQWAVRKLARK